MKTKRFLSALLCGAFLFALLPVTAQAVDHNITTGGTYTFAADSDSLTAAPAGDTINISTTAPVTLIGDSSILYQRFQIVCAIPNVSLTINNVKINNMAQGSYCALSFTGAGNTLTFVGDNQLFSGTNYPGIKVESGTTLTINGTGLLRTQGDPAGAGIGGGNGNSCGTVIIESGEIFTQGSGGSGIGGGGGFGTAGIGGNGGTVTISGGKVTAIGDTGIGGGYAGTGGNGGTVTISGGTVYAYGDVSMGMDIGAARGASTDGTAGTLKISGGSVKLENGASDTSRAADGTTNVYRTTLSLTPNTSISTESITFGGVASSYNKNGLRTDGDGNLYLYLPTGTASAQYGGASYTETVENNHNNAFMMIPILDLNGTAAGTGASVAYTAGGPAVALVGSSATLRDDDSANMSQAVVTITNPELGEDMLTVSGYSNGDTVNGITITYISDTVLALSGTGTKADYLALLRAVQYASSAPAPVGAGRDVSFVVRDSDTNASAASSVHISIVYTITATAGSGGTIDPSGAVSVVWGNDRTFAITPDSGYAISSVLVDGAGVGAPASYTFGGVSAHHTISAAFDAIASADGGGSSFGYTAYYDVLAEQSIGGRVAASPRRVQSGGSAVVTATPDAGYKIKDLLVNGVSVGAVTSYTIENIRADTSVNAVFAFINPFGDLSPGDWYYDAVMLLAERKITAGTGDGTTFSPEATLTRGDFLVLLMRAYGIAPDENPADNFADGGDTYYTGYLAAAKRLKITAGVGNNMFAPTLDITRQEMFTLLYNALKSVGQLPRGDSGETLFDFSDASQIAPWAREAMTLLVETGTISGSGGKLSPNGTATRAQMAQALYNLMS